MVSYTRDKDELGNADFITFWVWMYCPSGGKEVVSGCLQFDNPIAKKAGIDSIRMRTPIYLPVDQAFNEALRYAESEGISVIWINDPDQRFDVEPWVRKGLITRFGSHS